MKITKINEERSVVDTNGGTSNTMGDIDAAASLEQVPTVYQPSAKNDLLAEKDIDEGHGGINSIVEIKPAGDSISFHQSVGEQPAIAGSLTRPTVEYSHGGEFEDV